MGNAVTTLLDGSSFGLQFDYSLWTPGTNVTLCNVTFDSMYRDVVYYETDAGAVRQITGASTESVTIEQMTYCAYGRPVRINLPFSEANRFNYLVVRNPSMPLGQTNRPSVFFYFINSVEYIAPNTTALIIQLDVWQTYSRHVKLGQCYIERGHYGIVRERYYYTGTYGYAYDHLTVPEGFNLGTDYVVKSAFSKTLADPIAASTQTLTDDSISPIVVICSTTSLSSDFGDEFNPKLKVGNGSTAEGLPNSCEIYLCTLQNFSKVTEYLRDYPWVSQGIISITMVPPTAFPGGYSTVARGATALNGGKGPAVLVKPGNPFVLKQHPIAMITNLRDAMRACLPKRYRSLTKFYTFPYSAIELTSYTGTPLVLKPELLGSSLSLMQHSHIAPPAPRIMFSVQVYNDGRIIGDTGGDKDPGNSTKDRAEYFDMMLGITNMPTFSVNNNSYMAFMASNAHSIAYQYQAADWSQQKAQMAINTAYNQASQGISSSNAMLGISNAFNMQRAEMQKDFNGRSAAIGMTTSIGGALASLSPGAMVGSAIGAIGTAGQTHLQNNMTMGMAQLGNSQASAMNNVQTNLAAYNRDTNRQLAESVAQTDYQSAIAAINAKVQDAQVLQPTVSGQVGGEAFNLAVDGWRVVAKIKTIPENTLRFIGEFWLRYGYAMNVFDTMPSRFQVMSNFTYWKCSDVRVVSSTCPEEFRQTIRGIFETGVTVWNDMNKIGVIDFADNQPLDNWE